MIIKQEIERLVEEKLAGTDKFLVEITVNKLNKINIWVDGDNGVTISDCVKISRHIESTLDRDKEDFSLEVSSYGLDQPLKLQRQYKNHLGKQIQIVDVKNQIFKGKLIEFDDKNIKLEIELTKRQIKENREKIISLKFDEIKEIKVVISFKNK